MTVALGIVALAVGLVVVTGQLISTLDFARAQRLGLQERDEETDPLHRRLELNTARWDLFVLWTLPLAGVAMLIDASWWPWVALITGSACVDTGGREGAKLLALRAEDIRVGTGQEQRNLFALYGLLAAVGSALIVHALVTLA
ncbi:MAG: hypothetical protein JJE10_09665 [Thermoleophilia bacterium]|nr:hypothetical protein [Thermoleophilia bacterium]